MRLETTFRELISSAKHYAILCHHNADPDAIGSAYAIHWLCKQINPKADGAIIAVGGASQLTMKCSQRTRYLQ